LATWRRPTWELPPSWPSVAPLEPPVAAMLDQWPPPAALSGRRTDRRSDRMPRPGKGPRPPRHGLFLPPPLLEEEISFKGPGPTSTGKGEDLAKAPPPCARSSRKKWLSWCKVFVRQNSRAASSLSFSERRQSKPLRRRRLLLPQPNDGVAAAAARRSMVSGYGRRGWRCCGGKS
jgi:hypothetical protein